MGSEQTSSSRRVGEVGDEGGMILYVMRTFLALRHMGRVLCVTDQVAWSHSSGGDWKEVEEGRVGLYFLGERRLIGEFVEMALGSDGGAATTIVVSLGDSPRGSVSAILGEAFWLCWLDLRRH